MNDARVIRASFSDYRTVKGRKVLQLVMEVPIEQQADVFAKLGYPMPDSDRWCAIALLQDPASLTPEPPELAVRPPSQSAPGATHTKDLVLSQAAKERYRSKDAAEQASARAHMMAKNPKFIAWACDRAGIIRDEGNALAIIRAECGVGSCSELAHNGRAYEAFLNLETTFREADGQIAEIR